MKTAGPFPLQRLNWNCRGGSPSYRTAVREAVRKSPDWDLVTRRLRSAHRAGEPRAGYALGTWHYYGTHLEKDIGKALKLMREAVRQGGPGAQFFLATEFESGEFIPQNARRAFALYLKAASAGHRYAALSLAICYRQGFGCDKDPLAARAWTTLAESMDIPGEHLLPLRSRGAR